VGRAQYGKALGSAWLRLALLGTPIALSAVLIQSDPSAATAVAIALVVVFVMLVVSVFQRVERLPTWVVVLTTVTAAPMLGVFVGVLTPEASESASLVAIAAAMSTVWLPRRAGLMAVCTGAIGYAITLQVRHIDHLPARAVVVVGFAAAAVLTMGSVLDRVEDLAAEERAAAAEVQRLAAAAAQARAELAEANDLLAQRVEEQVGRIEGLGRLRQFLSPQVADAVEADALAPHRGQIAVVFCDLRGFTRFSNSSEPEELLDVLEGYYAVVGAKLREYDATVGSFQGDGILAYFNDPVPCEDPAGRAVKMALDLRAPLDGLCARWARRGSDLGYGMGIAYGYATLGTIGFEGRLDYTPLGSVVNMASRLGDEADWGEILIDGRALHAVDDRVEVEGRQLELKGFPSAVPAYSVLAAPGL
jgi:class 3 adenylate cyclase